MKQNFLILFFTLPIFSSLAHEQVVHEAITVNAAESAYANSPAFASFINTINSDGRLLKDTTNSMAKGSFEEDDNAKRDPVGGNRSYNHFYDPLDTTYGKGLTDVPNDRRSSSPVGNNSFVWGSTSNCAGINYYELNSTRQP
jgi:hypothetical protein